MRVAVLWSNVVGYLDACLAALQSLHNAELFVSHRAIDEGLAQSSAARPGWVGSSYQYDVRPDGAELERRLAKFDPHVILFCGWMFREYNAIARQQRGRALRLIYFDTQWLATLRQFLGCAWGHLIIRSMFDFAILPGARQFRFGRYLGFPADRLVQGMISCNTDLFACAGKQRMLKPFIRPSRFLFVGRLSAEKGLEVLIEAYQAYRRSARDPWSLTLCGEGPLHERLAGIEGVELRGFVQPAMLAHLFSEDWPCLVLPSLREAWGVVIHEAAAAGLPVICSDACGAADQFVRHIGNGFILRPNSIDDLASAMASVSQWPIDRYRASAELGQRLAMEITPTTWANRIAELAETWPRSKGKGRDSRAATRDEGLDSLLGYPRPLVLRRRT